MHVPISTPLYGSQYTHLEYFSDTHVSPLSALVSHHSYTQLHVPDQAATFTLVIHTATCPRLGGYFHITHTHSYMSPIRGLRLHHSYTQLQVLEQVATFVSLIHTATCPQLGGYFHITHAHSYMSPIRRLLSHNACTQLRVPIIQLITHHSYTE